MWPTPLRKLFPTPQCADATIGNILNDKTDIYFLESGMPRKRSNKGVDGSVGLARFVNVMWPTPRSGKTTDENAETWMKRKEAGNVSTPPLNLVVKMWRTPTAYDWKNTGCSTQTYLSDQVRPEQVTNAKKLWPTPSSNNGTGGCTGLAGGSGNREKLYSVMGEEEGKKLGCGSLNPDWVAWLMGWPIGWESLESIKELKWLDWSVDPADMEKPKDFRTPAKSEPGVAVSRLRPIENGELGGMNRHFDIETGRMAQIGLTQQVQCRNTSTGPIPRVASGTKDRVNRLKALGNGQVPLCAATAWRLLTGLPPERG